MKRLVSLTGFFLVLSMPVNAVAQTPTRQHTLRYDHAYHAVSSKFGRRAPGRNIARWGLVSGKAASDADIVRSTGVLERMLVPPAPVPHYGAVSYNQPANTTASPSYAVGSGSLPYCTWGPESGGNWSAVNPSSGAGGRYQILPSTWAAYGGTGSPATASPAEQTAIATKIYAGGAGASQWVNC